MRGAPPGRAGPDPSAGSAPSAGSDPSAGGAGWLVLPLAVFLLWRGSHALLVLALGGDPVAATYSFDAPYYLSILREGYVEPPGGYGQFSNVAFFPGLAWLTEAVRAVVRDETVATLLVANGLALAAFVTVCGACRAWVGAGPGRRATVALALLPSSYYLWMYYTEALLVASTAGAAWAARRDRHLVSLPLLALAATSRTVGVVAGPALALARVVRLRRVDGVAVAYLVASTAGLAAVALRQQVELGDPLAFTRAQQAWGRGFAPPWEPFVGAARAIAGPGAQPGVLLDVVTAVGVAVGVLVLVLWWRRGAVPAEAPALAAATWSVPLLSTLLSSQVRFALGVWPVLLLPALWWPRWPLWLRVLVLLGAVGLGVALLQRLATGVFTA